MHFHFLLVLQKAFGPYSAYKMMDLITVTFTKITKVLGYAVPLCQLFEQIGFGKYQ